MSVGQKGSAGIGTERQRIVWGFNCSDVILVPTNDLDHGIISPAEEAPWRLRFSGLMGVTPGFDPLPRA